MKVSPTSVQDVVYDGGRRRKLISNQSVAFGSNFYEKSRTCTSVITSKVIPLVVIDHESHLVVAQSLSVEFIVFWEKVLIIVMGILSQSLALAIVILVS